MDSNNNLVIQKFSHLEIPNKHQYLIDITNDTKRLGSLTPSIILIVDTKDFHVCWSVVEINLVNMHEGGSYHMSGEQ